MTLSEVKTGGIMKQVTTVEEATKLLTDRAEELGADANDSTGVVRQLVTDHSLSFNAWFVICCELADRKAQKAGFTGQADRAASLMKVASK